MKTTELPDSTEQDRLLKIFAKTKFGLEIPEDEVDALTRHFQNEVGESVGAVVRRLRETSHTDRISHRRS